MGKHGTLTADQVIRFRHGFAMITREHDRRVATEIEFLNLVEHFPDMMIGVGNAAVIQ